MMRVDLTENEIAVLEMRKKQIPFSKIADILGIKHYQRIQAIHRTALEKIRKFRWLQESDPQLMRAAKENGLSYTQLFKLMNILDRNDILDSYKSVGTETLSQIEGIGEKYTKTLEDSKRLS